MRVTLKHLRMVQTVAEEGTLTGAGRRLYLTQSALSHQLAALERRVGMPVFDRVGKRMVPTAAGRRILAAANEVLEVLSELETDLRARARGVVGEIRLTMECYTGYHWLPEVLPAFRSAHPGVEVRIVPQASARVADALLGGEIDLALSYGDEPPAALDAVPLFEDDLVLIVAPDHALAERAWVEAADLEEEHLLVHVDNRPDSMLFRRVLMPAGVVPRQVSEVRLTEAIVALVAAGVGVSVITRWSVAPEIRSGRVRAVRVTECGLRRSWHALMRRQSERPVWLDGFLALLRRGPARLFDAPSKCDERAVCGIVEPTPS